MKILILTIAFTIVSVVGNWASYNKGKADGKAEAAVQWNRVQPSSFKAPRSEFHRQGFRRAQ